VTRRALLCALLLAGACLPAVEGDGGAAARPLPAASGAPEGPPVVATIGREGGTLASADARLTVAVPAGAVAAPTAFSVQEITNTAPGGVGTAYRLAPHGTALAAPVTLVFQVEAGSGSLDRLAVATQERGGYWLRHRRVVRDPAVGTITATVEHFSDWAVQTAATDRDLRGTFTIDSTIGLPFTATGEALLDFAGEDSAGAYFLQSGTISAPASIPSGASTCAPDRPAHALPTNIAEIAAASAPPAFEWGVSGHWPLTCTWSGGSTTADFISLAFDTYGINLLGCARSYVGTPVVTATAVQGSYVIDCGVEGRVSARWDFAACPAGAACTSTNPCRTAAMSCDTGVPVCTESGNVADGTSCGTDQVCGGGVCSACAAGVDCTPADACTVHQTSCATGTSTCADTAVPVADGTSCGTGLTCVGGVCG
jgi:hypothetical protein